MAGLLYWTDKRVPLRASDLDELQVRYAFERVPAYTQAKGPTGVDGILFADEARLNGKPIKAIGEKQTWKKIGPNLWCGYYNDAKPEPLDLARTDSLTGYTVALADGNEWTIPLCRIFSDDGTHDSRLPRYRDIDENGKWFDGDHVDKYQHLAEVCKSFFDQWHAGLLATTEGTTDEWNVQVNDNDALTLLQTNYVVGAGEVALLRLFDNSGKVEAVMMLACDCGKAYRYIMDKKKEPVSTG